VRLVSLRLLHAALDDADAVETHVTLTQFDVLQSNGSKFATRAVPISVTTSQCGDIWGSVLLDSGSVVVLSQSLLTVSGEI
jgi:hypothetical protein